MCAQGIAVVHHPLPVLSLQRQGNPTALMEISLINGPVYQLIYHHIQFFLPIRISVDQFQAVLVDSFQIHHQILPVHIDAHFRINGHVNRAASPIPRLKHGSRCQHQAGSSRGQGINPSASLSLFIPPGLRYLHLHKIRHHLPRLIVQVGGFQKTSILAQDDCIGEMAFHYHIFHAGRPPFRTCLRWPRMISYPLV